MILKLSTKIAYQYLLTSAVNKRMNKLITNAIIFTPSLFKLQKNIEIYIVIIDFNVPNSLVQTIL